MTGPRCLPEHLREREKGKKGRTAPATIGQLRLHAGVHGMASRNRCKSPSLATTTASASAHVPYYKKNHFVALLGSFTPVWIYFLYSISSFTKKKKSLLRPSFVTDAVHKRSITPSLSSLGSYSVGQGDGTSLPNLGFFLRPARGHAGNNQPKERGSSTMRNRTRTLGTTTNDKRQQQTNKLRVE